MGRQRDPHSKASRIRVLHAEHPEWTYMELAAQVGGSWEYVRDVLTDRKARKKDRAEWTAPGDREVQKRLQAAEKRAGHALDEAERMRLLAQIARDPEAGKAARIAAMRESRKDESATEERRLGPGPPLTTAERVERLSLLLEACGPEVSRAAWEKTWPSQAQG